MSSHNELMDTKIKELIESIKNNELNSEEAAQSLAGWTMKNDSRWEKWIAKGFRTHEGLLSLCRLIVESHMEGFKGIDPERHMVC